MEAIKVRGIEEVQARMDRLGRNLKQRSGRRVIRAALEPMLQAAESRTPKKTGKLRNHWKIKVGFDDRGQAMGWVTNTFFTAYFLELGHKIVKIERHGVKRRGRYEGGRTKHVVGYASGKNFLRSAFEATAEQCINTAANEMKKSLDGALMQAGGK